MAFDPTFISVDLNRMRDHYSDEMTADTLFHLAMFCDGYRFFVNGIEYPFVAEIDTERGYADVLEGYPVIKHRLWGHCEIHVVNP
ncbi:MAG TPA: hypothetical protein VN755_07580 [Steroidobacteraceae bacterium]|nr:hypothetical protein [Steroidobacteraceae bacterium]